ncbi:hypothetical protein [Microvirga massiliensis]|uniref:hypothetical protein n=1 Tax=Microvirga massiliensis TaxID=1033741 RepID=UPI000699E556|nr:hypothetical protein [Microvirga massiliensis]
MDDRLIHNLGKLPNYAAVSHPVERITVLIERGVMGYIRPPHPIDREAFNRLHGVTPAQAAAMLHGSMFGFYVPAADPDHPMHQLPAAPDCMARD